MKKHIANFTLDLARYFLGLCIFGIVAILFLNLVTPGNAQMKIEKSNGEVRIFIGSFDYTTPLGYSAARNNFLQRLSRDNSEDTFEAVVCLDDYCSEDEINELVNSHNLQVEVTYLWVPGETGTCQLGSQIQDYKKELENAYASGMKTYALLVSGTAQELTELSEAPMVAHVDVMYNPEAEAYAAKRNMSYSYIILPTKPDGAH